MAPLTYQNTKLKKEEDGDAVNEAKKMEGNRKNQQICVRPTVE